MHPMCGLPKRSNSTKLVAAYRGLYPLFQRAYAELGYPDAYFNDRLVEVIDHLLGAAPATEPLRLVRPKIFYQFADPELESLSAGRRLLLRIGNDNAHASRPSCANCAPDRDRARHNAPLTDGADSARHQPRRGSKRSARASW